MNNLLNAFRSVDFNWTRDLQSVWFDPPFQVNDVHRAVVDEIMEDFVAKTNDPNSNPVGRVILGPAGAGKTHLIGTLRRRVWDANGWFVLLDIIGITDFWATAALGFLNSLHQPMADGRAQYEAVLSTIARTLPLDAAAREAIARWEKSPESERLGVPGLFLTLLRHADPRGSLQHEDVVRAVLLLGSEDWNARNLAYCWLQGLDADEDERRRLGFRGAPPAYPELVRGMLWLMSLGGPIMIAVDQIDAIVSASNLLAGVDGDPEDDAQRKARAIINLLAGGLMDLHDLKRRAMTVLSCLEVTWPIIEARAVKSVGARFNEITALRPISDRNIVEKLIASRLTPAYAKLHFTPPYPTWPFRAEAIDTATGMLPRRILIRCDEHQRRCKSNAAVSECFSLNDNAPPPPEPIRSGIDEEFRNEVRATDCRGFLDKENEDALLCDLLLDMAELYVRHLDLPDDIDITVQGDPDRKKPSLHCRIAFIFRSEADREQHFCFRAIAHTNAIAFQARLRAAMTASGIDRALKFRHLFVLRSSDPPRGAKTAQLVDKFRQASGRFIALTDDDLRAFVALRAMAGRRLDGFDAWLHARKPLFDTPLFKAAGLAPPAFLPPGPHPDGGPASGPPRPDDGPAPDIKTHAPPTSAPPSGTAIRARDAAQTQAPLPRPKPILREIPLGHRYERGTLGAAVALPAELLRRHVAILAGSGSGKTVLLRRIVEEAALLGIPAIVLDSNNDLARLGEPWPAAPEGWTAEDGAKAADYRRHVEVAIWTPGRNSGRPMSLALLPDFAALRQDEDEREQAIEMARATLAPYLGSKSATAKLRDGVLADTLRSFARAGGGGLDQLVDMLVELPDDVSTIDDAPKLASAIANQLRAAIATNPLLQSRGSALDPGVLFKAAAGKTGISVLNLSGLGSDEARQSFVNQLQMSLFTWIKRNPSPAGRGRLYVLDEAQNFAPSQKLTPCKESALSLAAQARKYGLGMIFATQTPKGIDNKIISNCTTQFYGRMSAPATIEATRELMAAKGGSGEDIGRLARGEFYFSTEAVKRPIRIRTPLCLTWHPANPLTIDEVTAKARANG